MSKFDEILNSSDASDALLGEQIDALEQKLEAKADVKKIDDIALFIKFPISGNSWYRIFVMNSTAAAIAKGSGDLSADLVIKRSYNNSNNEHHSISLKAVYTKAEFINENSVSNTLLVDKIRMVVANTSSYIDIHVNNSAYNEICAYLLFPNIAFKGISAPWKEMPNSVVPLVPETATGEEVVATYTFSANRTIESRLKALEAKAGI